MRLARLTPTLALSALALSALPACQTAPAAPSGLLTRYDGLASPGFSLRASIRQRRDDDAVAGIGRVYLQPAVLADGAGGDLDEGERQAVLREVDRRLCFTLSRRFEVTAEPASDAAVVRTVVTEINPTGRTASAVSAVAGYFNPIPLTDVRVPRTTGGLAVESELLSPEGVQIAAVTWARDATVIGRESPSFSRIGDAVQLVKPMGGVVEKAFADARERRPVGDPDPCAAYGPRRAPARWLGAKVFGFVTGLHQPEVTGLAAPAEQR